LNGILWSGDRLIDAPDYFKGIEYHATTDYREFLRVEAS